MIDFIILGLPAPFSDNDSTEKAHHDFMFLVCLVPTSRLRFGLSSSHLSYRVSQSSAAAGSAIRSNDSLSRCYLTHAVTFPLRSQSGGSQLGLLLWVRDEPGRSAGQTSMTCRSGVLQTRWSAACHQMHLSERRGREGSSPGTRVQSDAA